MDKKIPWATHKTTANNYFLQNISDYWKFIYHFGGHWVSKPMQFEHLFGDIIPHSEFINTGFARTLKSRK